MSRSLTCFRTADGAFHAFEGSRDQLGCCFGNCTHVWNYEVATPHLFPGLSRSLRDAAFGFCTSERGLMDFRQLLPPDKQSWGFAAADGQNIWLVGGGDLVGQFADQGLLDEILLGIAPVMLGAGAPLLPRRLGADRLTLQGVEHDERFVFLTYRVGHG